MVDDPNRPETEQDGIRAEALRRLKVRQLLKAQPAPTPDLSPSPSSTPSKPASTSKGKARSSK